MILNPSLPRENHRNILSLLKQMLCFDIRSLEWMEIKAEPICLVGGAALGIDHSELQ